MSSDNNPSSVKVLITALAVFLGFGIVTTLVFCRLVGHESVQDKAAIGVFNQETIDLRNKNSQEVKAAQNALINRKSIAAAEKQMASTIGVMRASKSSVVLPGSPAFLKQMKDAAAADEAAKKKAEAAKAKPAPAPPAPKPAAPKPAAPKVSAPAKPKAPPVKAAPAKPKVKPTPVAPKTKPAAPKAAAPAKPKAPPAKAPAKPKAK